jgi:hypothetical protein
LFGKRNKLRGLDVPQAMRHDSISTIRPGLDWKGLGYITSIVSVLLLGAVAWPKPGEPTWHIAALLAGMATSILGMAFRYKAHLDQKRELRRAEAKADGASRR